MKVIVVSDSHGKDNVLEEILAKHSDADVYVHCGDIDAESGTFPQFVTVLGNNDIYYDYPEERILHVAGHGIFVTHSHRFVFGQRLEQMAARAKDLECDIVFYGHTHIAADDTVNGVRLINPGSVWRSRDGNGPSYAIVTFDQEQIDVEFVRLPQPKSRWGFF